MPRKPKAVAKIVWPIVFNPLAYLSQFDQEQLLPRLLAGMGGTSFTGLTALRRRERWAMELPLGTFSGNLQPGATAVDDEVGKRCDYIEGIRSRIGGYHFRPTRHIFQYDGRWYYHIEALKVLRYAPDNELFLAAIAFLEAAQADPKLIQGPRYQRRLTPIEDRPVVDGHRARGAGWTLAEDKILAQWFGRRADGGHHPLTDEHWHTVLDLLNGYRTKKTIKDRLSVLNRKLKISLLVDGYIPREHMTAFRRGFLGEQFRVPNFRPRLHGTYFTAGPAPAPRKRRNQATTSGAAAPDATSDAPPSPAPSSSEARHDHHR